MARACWTSSTSSNFPPTMPNATKPKAVLVSDNAMVELLKRKAIAFRESAKLKDNDGYVKGLGAYALYGISHARGQLIVLASEPTAGDFNKYVTAKAKAEVCARYDHVVEYRDAGSYSRPKATILCWELAK
jgi:hypothetical protein